MEHPTWKAPNLENTIALLSYLQQRNKLKEMLARERSTANPGLPDLFLWQRTKEGALTGGQFVEVKRSTHRPSLKEAESAEERSERMFLKSLGIRARVLYLVQR